jgi:hypothetical protein
MTERKRRQHSPAQIVKKPGDADAMLNSGKDFSAALQPLGMFEATYHHCSNHQYGRMKSSEAKTSEGA